MLLNTWSTKVLVVGNKLQFPTLGTPSFFPKNRNHLARGGFVPFSERLFICIDRTTVGTAGVLPPAPKS